MQSFYYGNQITGKLIGTRYVYLLLFVKHAGSISDNLKTLDYFLRKEKLG